MLLLLLLMLLLLLLLMLILPELSDEDGEFCHNRSCDRKQKFCDWIMS